MVTVVHYLLTFGEWIGASYKRSVVLMSVVVLIILLAD
jgi:hypothetical protein